MPETRPNCDDLARIPLQPHSSRHMQHHLQPLQLLVPQELDHRRVRSSRIPQHMLLRAASGRSEAVEVEQLGERSNRLTVNTQVVDMEVSSRRMIEEHQMESQGQANENLLV